MKILSLLLLTVVTAQYWMDDIDESEPETIEILSEPGPGKNEFGTATEVINLNWSTNGRIATRAIKE